MQEQVLNFTKAFANIPDSAVVYDEDELKLIISLVASELVEFANTRMPLADAIHCVQDGAFKDISKKLTDEDKEKLFEISSKQTNILYDNLPDVFQQDIKEYKMEQTHVIMAEQMDAIVDAMYYLMDSSNRHGIYLMDIFNEVHQANMNKLYDGHAIIENGKLEKPDNWQPPDINKIAIDQLERSPLCDILNKINA